MDSHDEAFDLPPYKLESWMPFLFSSDEINGKGINETQITGFGNVICRENVQEGETLELVPVLVLSKSLVKGTIIESLVVEWKDLESLPNDKLDDEVRSIVFPEVVKEGLLSMVKLKKYEIARDETVVFGLAGCLTLIKRCMNEYNCCCLVERDPCNDGGFLVRVVAAKSILSGERVVAKLPAQRDLARIVEELALSGQPVATEFLPDD
jgi:hypothetical protein